jgi:hypothetical protein
MIPEAEGIPVKRPPLDKAALRGLLRGLKVDVEEL